MGAGALGVPVIQPLAASSSTAAANPPCLCLGGKGRSGALWLCPGGGGCAVRCSHSSFPVARCTSKLLQCPPLSPAHQASRETRASSSCCPHPPPGRLCHSCTDSSQHTQCLLSAGTLLVILCPLLKIPHGAVGVCLVLLEPRTWSGPPLGSQRSWDMEVSALVLLLSYVTVKVLAPDCSVHHPELVWRSISCICFLIVLLSACPEPTCEGWFPVCSVLSIINSTGTAVTGAAGTSECKCRVVFLLGFK